MLRCKRRSQLPRYRAPVRPHVLRPLPCRYGMVVSSNAAIECRGIRPIIIRPPVRSDDYGADQRAFYFMQIPRLDVEISVRILCTIFAMRSGAVEFIDSLARSSSPEKICHSPGSPCSASCVPCSISLWKQAARRDGRISALSTLFRATPHSSSLILINFTSRVSSSRSWPMSSCTTRR